MYILLNKGPPLPPQGGRPCISSVCEVANEPEGDGDLTVVGVVLCSLLFCSIQSIFKVSTSLLLNNKNIVGI